MRRMIADQECGIVIGTMASPVSRRSTVALLGGGALWAQGVAREPTARKQNVVLTCGDTQHDAERSLTSLAQQLESRHGMRCNILAASSPRDLPGLDALEDAHVAVMFLDGLTLPRDQMAAIRGYVEADKPIVALRATVRAFSNWPEFGPQVLGAAFQYDYGAESSTNVTLVPQAVSHGALKGLPQEFHCRSSLYQLGALGTGTTPLLMGTSTGQSDRATRTPNPVAWTRTQKGARIFATTLGHPEDFQILAYRLLLVNGIGWALAR
jgi:hypothetical protein